VTPAEAAKAVLVLQSAYPGARMTEMTAELYEHLLADLDAEVAQRAIARLVCISKFLPTIAEIRDAAADVALGAARSGLEAWGDVLMAIRRTGSYGVPTFTDPLVAECVRILGWRTLCLGDSPEAVDRARFAELYVDLQRRRRQNDVSEPGRLLPSREPAQLPGNVHELVRRVGR
jgi:hypothetical protein